MFVYLCMCDRERELSETILKSYSERLKCQNARILKLTGAKSVNVLSAI